MWENKEDAEKIEEQQQKYDKLAAVGLKKLRILSAVGAAILLFHIAVMGIRSPYVLVPAVTFYVVAGFCFYKNVEFGFYAMCAALFFCTAVWASDIYKLIALTIALFGKSDDKAQMWLHFIAMLSFLTCYIVTFWLLLLDEDIRTWKTFGRHSK